MAWPTSTSLCNAIQKPWGPSNSLYCSHNKSFTLLLRWLDWLVLPYCSTSISIALRKRSHTWNRLLLYSEKPVYLRMPLAIQLRSCSAPIGGQTGASSTISTEEIQQIISNTVAVMTTVQDWRAGWREVIAKALQDAKQRGADWQIEIDFFSAVLGILDGGAPTLPADHPYDQAIATIQAGIASGGPQVIEVSEEVMQAVQDFVNAGNWDATRQVVEALQALLFQPEVETILEQNIEQARATGQEEAATFEQLAVAAGEPLPFDAQLAPRSIEALLGGPQEKREHAQYLAALSAQTTNEELKALINTIQLALFGSDPSQLGQNLQGAYRQAWEDIVAGVETTGGTSS